MERVFVFVPVVPQDLEQVPYLDQPETLQSMGQAKRLQSESALSEAHAFPPLAAAVIVERVFVFVPVVPQDLEQVS